FASAERGAIGLVGPAQKAGQAAAEVGDLVLETAGAVEVLEPLVEGFIEANDHGGGGLEAALEHRPLGGEVVGHRVLELAVAAAEGFGEDFRAATGDPVDPGRLEALRGLGPGELGVIGEVHKLGYGQGVKLEPAVVALA